MFCDIHSAPDVCSRPVWLPRRSWQTGTSACYQYSGFSLYTICLSKDFLIELNTPKNKYLSMPEINDI